MSAAARKSAPPTPEARAEVLRVVAAAAEPMLASAIAKLVAPPHKIAPKDLGPVLQEFVATGQLCSVPGKSATGKPRYWDRDPAALARAAALDAIEKSDQPLTAAELVRSLKPTIKLSAAELTRLLEKSAAAGALHEFPATTAKGKPRYWHHDPVEFGRGCLLNTLNSQGPQTESGLRKVLKGYADPQFREILSGLIESRQVWRHPPLGKSKGELYGSRPPAPGLYLREIELQLSAVIAKLRAVDVPLEELRRSVVQMVEAAGVSFTLTSAVVREASASTAAVDLVSVMKRIEPGAERGALVGARDLRRAVPLRKEDFDRAVLELSRQGRLSLHRHDYVSSLTPTERDELVTDGQGTYYIGVALRQS